MRSKLFSIRCIVPPGHFQALSQTSFCARKFPAHHDALSLHRSFRVALKQSHACLFIFHYSPLFSSENELQAHHHADICLSIARHTSGLATNKLKLARHYQRADFYRGDEAAVAQAAKADARDDKSIAKRIIAPAAADISTPSTAMRCAGMKPTRFDARRSQRFRLMPAGQLDARAHTPTMPIEKQLRFSRQAGHDCRPTNCRAAASAPPPFRRTIARAISSSMPRRRKHGAEHGRPPPSISRAAGRRRRRCRWPMMAR